MGDFTVRAMLASRTHEFKFWNDEAAATELYDALARAGKDVMLSSRQPDLLLRQSHPTEERR